MSGLRSEVDFTHFFRISALLLFGRWWRQERYFTIVDRLVFGRISTSSISCYWCPLERYVTPCRLFSVRSALDVAHFLSLFSLALLLYSYRYLVFDRIATLLSSLLVCSIACLFAYGFVALSACLLLVCFASCSCA